ncbi:MAG: diguanylate cyclase [Polaromonas sp.]|uniref:diguanylate cyclase domain-containing protein n=1 Tax=Polaromonas sp. TaxID=1869339 RepID=UPI002730010D|nr:diguanylate cyclase [Polaromonas sp.]MDP1739951.1 diguanylate cyclase [Polaromonas sp.]MDP1954272.1 diguanylate cyclase [Polaromonas sp.]MDP3249069.1 diguanylate cyclase [Polaromonas sp.]MDP3750377.1 diguanylate cyclase [Polaromonas sp.]
MNPVFSPEVFVLGVAAGVLGLVLLFSLIIAYAYDEPTLFALGGYLLVVMLILVAGRQMLWPADAVESVLLILGPTCVAGLHAWLLRRRQVSAAGKAVIALAALLAVSIAALRVLDSSPLAVMSSSYGLAALLALSWLYLCLPAWRISGPWKWWLLLGHLGGAVVAVLFLSGSAGVQANYWPVAMMLLLQLPPSYLALVWRSRMLNESRLRGAAARVTDPLTGLDSLAVLIDRLRPAVARAQRVAHGGALYLIEVQNLAGLLKELGPDAKEKIVLEAASRVRRAVSDSDTAARIGEQLFAVLAQDLQDNAEVDSLATKLVVSGLRIESAFLPGVALQFRVIVTDLKVQMLDNAASTQYWLRSLTGHFSAWPDTHRSRSILLFGGGQVRRPQAPTASQF